MNQASVSMISVNGIKAKVVKGEENRHVSSNMDANKMAQMQADKLKQQQMLKRQKIESFMNSTRLNANRLYKEQCNKNLQQINNKKEILGKQKQLKAKYTITQKKSDKIIKKQQADQVQQIKKLPKQPIHVNWKQAQQACVKIHIPENCEVEDSSEGQSGYDSEIDRQKNQTPEQVTNFRNKIRKQMIQKFKKMSS